MKKITAIILCLVLALGAFALAESIETKTEIGSLDVNGAFTLKASLPEGYEIINYENDDLSSIWYIACEDTLKPIMILSIGFDEAYADVYRINDLSEEELNDLIETWYEYEADITMTETAYGTKLIQVIETGDYTDFVDIFAIYRGYCVEFIMIPGDDADSLTQEQIDRCVEFLSELDFVPIEK